MTEDFSQEKKYSFVQKIWITGGILALITAILLLFRSTFNVFVLVLGGTLIAIYFRGMANLIEKKTHWRSWVAMTISVGGTILLLTGLFWLIGSEAQNQMSQLSKTLPETYENAKDYLNRTWLGREVIDRISSAGDGKMTSVFSTFFRTTFGILGDLYVILLIGAYLTAAPLLYTKGITKLVPPKGRKKAEDVLAHLDESMKQWILGKLFAMLVVFVLTAIGLKILGMPMWLALAIIAGFLNFIPNFGPLLAMIPAVLVALSINPQTALIVAGIYILVQFLESNFITPKIQQRLTSVPPALIITSQLIVASFAGIWGIALATPIILVVIILVRELHVKPMEQKQENRSD